MYLKVVERFAKHFQASPERSARLSTSRMRNGLCLLPMGGDTDAITLGAKKP
jgi:hypothetical protein